jgi:hypothetical protein
MVEIPADALLQSAIIQSYQNQKVRHSLKIHYRQLRRANPQPQKIPAHAGALFLSEPIQSYPAFWSFAGMMIP